MLFQQKNWKGREFDRLCDMQQFSLFHSIQWGTEFKPRNVVMKSRWRREQPWGLILCTVRQYPTFSFSSSSYDVCNPLFVRPEKIMAGAPNENNAEKFTTCNKLLLFVSYNWIEISDTKWAVDLCFSSAFLKALSQPMLASSTSWPWESIS
jgi:hypothetical protein